MTRHAALVLFLGIALISGAAAQQTKPPPKAPDPKPVMCKKGDLIFEESFTGGAYAKEWFKITGKWVIENDQAKAAEQASDNHHSELSHPVTSSNLIIQFSFKLEGAKMLAIGLENKEHVARAIASPESFQIMKWNGKKEEKRMKMEPGKWHTALWEIHDDEMVAQVDDQLVLYCRDEGLKEEKARMVLINYGEWAWFDDVKVWKAEPDDKWPLKRKAFETQKKK
jgi:hypothetical protein